MNTSFCSVVGQRGVTLIELMIGMVLGLIVMGAAATVFMANSRTYAVTESLGRVQENARVAFELMARDVREAAGNPCERRLPVYNVINSPTSEWYTDFTAGIRGYGAGDAFPDDAFGTGPKQRITGTDAIEIKSAVSNGLAVVSHDPASAQFKMNTINHDLNDGDLVMACDFAQAAIFQVTNAQPGTNDTVVHNSGTGTPGNCSKGLGWSSPPNCTTNGNSYAFGCYMGLWAGGVCDDGDPATNPDTWPSTVAKLRMTRWYIGGNARGGRSLWQASLRNSAGVLSVEKNEIAEGVQDMSLTYLVRGGNDYVDASAVTAANWENGDVVAVRIDLSLEGTEAVGTDGNALQRRLIHTVTVRNLNE